MPSAAQALQPPPDRAIRTPRRGDALVPAAVHERGDDVLKHDPIADTTTMAAQRMRGVEWRALPADQRAELAPDRLQQA